ncbi:MAG: hypothetical protein IJ243_01830 [Prevotella sp.]|nr:hypothetical protein [Prevotella sp.]
MLKDYASRNMGAKHYSRMRQSMEATTERLPPTSWQNISVRSIVAVPRLWRKSANSETLEKVNSTLMLSD